MKVYSMILLTLFSLTFTACDDDDNSTTTYEEVVVVANRTGGSVSFINSETETVMATLTINGSEPMYIVYVPSKDKIYVGDRAQNQVHVIEPSTRSLEQSINVGSGVFHMWAGGQGNQLWVNNDIDNTVSVIDLNSNTIIQTIDIGLKPHDVFVNQAGTMAYVSILIGNETQTDSVFAYSTSNFQRVAAVAVGDDPHLFHIPTTNQLFVPNQSGELFVLNGDNLTIINMIDLSGSHGIFPSPNHDFLYITDLPGKQIYSVRTLDMTVASTINTDISIPHNVVVNEGGSKLFVTHSGGMANQVTAYALNNGVPTLTSTLITQNNPFGLVYYKRAIN